MIDKFEGTINLEIRCSLCGGHFTGPVYCLEKGELICSFCIKKLEVKNGEISK